MLRTIQEDIKATKTLTEDVHIMAINMKSLQKSQDEISKKVDSITSKEFLEYKENKKLIKQKILSAVTGSGITLVLGFIAWLIKRYIEIGGI